MESSLTAPAHPLSVINSVVERPEFGVSDDDELPHESGDGDDGLFAVAGELEEEGSELRMVP